MAQLGKRKRPLIAKRMETFKLKEVKETKTQKLKRAAKGFFKTTFAGAAGLAKRGVEFAQSEKGQAWAAGLGKVGTTTRRKKTKSKKSKKKTKSKRKK
jgi:hypothetical protein